MFFFVVAVGVQVLLLFECVLRRVLACLLPSNKSKLGQYADKSVIATGLSGFSQVFALPLQMLSSAASVSLGMLVVFFVVAVLSVVLAEYTPSMLTFVTRAYNRSVAPVVNTVLELSVLVNGLFRFLLPVYNALVYVPLQIMEQVVGPLAWQYAEKIPDMIANCTLAATALVLSLVEYIKRLGRCSLGAVEACGDAASCGSSFVEYDVNCFANPAFLTVDVMTTGVYTRRVFGSVREVLEDTCSVSAALVNLMLYPLLDFNLYKAVHCFVNSALSVVNGVVATASRCKYLQATGASAVDAAVGCTPDFLPMVLLWVEMARSVGSLVDNWLNTAAIVVLEAITGKDAGCGAYGIESTVAEAIQVFESDAARVRVVGLTEKTVAVTDGVHALYRSDSTQAWGSFVWPMPVSVLNGIAAVQANLASEGDDADELRSGLLGCECLDTPAGIELACATVPLMGGNLDMDSAYNMSTIHNINFDTVRTDGMTCARTMVRVVPLKFSKRRMGVPAGVGRDVDQNDPYNIFGLSGTQVSPFSVDAAIYVQPLCGGEGPECLPLTDSCYPWCMGLHVAGLGGQNISIMNAVRWEEYVSVRQTDCGVELDDGRKTCAPTNKLSVMVATLMDGKEQPSRCGLPTTMCVTNDHVVSSIAVQEYAQGSHTLAALKKSTGPVVRTSDQPFAVAGDFMLTILESRQWQQVRREVVVSRLYDAGSGMFGLAEELTIVRNRRRVEAVVCQTIDSTGCYATAAKNGLIVMPVSYFSYDNGRIPAASSKWAVHWAVNPDPAVLSPLYHYCATEQAVLSVIVRSSWSAARVWSLRTGRAQDMFYAESLPGEEMSLVSYMVVPGFQSGEDFSCTKVSSLKVVALEYINAQNVLVTVLEGRPMDIDPDTGDVCAQCVKRYRYFYLNPQRSDCVEPSEGEGAMFSCWKESEQWRSEDTALFGKMCPWADRMPRVGSMVAEVAAVGMWVVRLVLETLCVVPAAVASGGWPGLAEVMRPRLGKQTFHSMLDTSGVNLLSVEEIIRSINRASLHAASSLVRIVDAFRGLPGAGVLRNVAVGTTRILQHSDGIVELEDPIARQLEVIRGLPSAQLLSKFSDVSTESVATLPMGIPAHARLFLSVSSVMSLNLRLIRRTLIKAMRATDFKAAFLDIALSSIYESKDDFDSFLDSTRSQCHGLGEIIGGTSPWARMVQHACKLGPDGVDFVLQALRVMFVEYPVMACTCRLNENERVEEKADEVTRVCLSRFTPASQQRWMLDLLFSPDNRRRRDLCFASMDAANGRLLAAMDPFLHRLYRLAECASEGLDYLLTLFSADRTGCTSYLLSPYVLSLVPEPVDYWMGCMHTEDCRVTCLPEYTAFEEALREAQGGGVVPHFVHAMNIDVESYLFAPYGVQEDNFPPFEIIAMLELTSAACSTVCHGGAVGRCIAVAGLAHGEHAELAYYCLPVDITMYVFEYITPAPKFPSTVGNVVDIFILTACKVQAGSREWLLVVESKDDHTVAFVEIPGMSSRTVLFQTGDSPSDLRNGWLQSVTKIRVVPAMVEGGVAHVFVTGPRFQNSRGVPTCVHVSMSVEEQAGSLASLAPESRICANPAVVDDLRNSVCLDEACRQELVLPATLESPKEVIVRTWKEEWVPFQNSEERKFAIGERASSIARTLGADLANPVYLLEDRGARKQAVLSAVTRPVSTGHKLLAFDLIVCNAAGMTNSWINVVHLKVSGESGSEKVDAYTTKSTTVQKKIELTLECGVENCVGCVAPGNTVTAESANLQARCYAAQECGLSRCVGTIVNMRKPLCSLGKIMAQYVHFFRIVLGGVWRAVTSQIVLYVEFTKERKEAFEIGASVDESFMAATCQAKELIMHISATITSVIGAIGFASSKVSERDSILMNAVVDSRVHARFIMTLTTITNLLASIGNLPLYLLMYVRKSFMCTTNEAVALFDRLFDSDDKLDIHIGSRKLTESAQGTVGFCLGEQEKELMRDLASNERKLNVVLAQVITGFVQLGVKTLLQLIDSGIDMVVVYMISVMTALQDVLATSDWQNCRLPALRTNDVSRCACGDQSYSIPTQRKKERAKNGAMWCSGLMLLTAADGSDLVIWNPYSLQEILDKQQTQIKRFIKCMQNSLTVEKCTPPKLDVFAKQGAEVMQVISKCRSNYQKSKWDDAALLYSLFHPSEWRKGMLNDALIDDEYSKHRLRLRALSYSFDVAVSLDEVTWKCLRKALETSNSHHSCHELYIGRRETHFAYESIEVANTGADPFFVTDACRVFSGLSAPRSPSGATKTPYVWSADSANRVPVALLHEVIDTESVRHYKAVKSLQALVADVEALFWRLRPETLDQDLKVAAFSNEGDELHQLVDCVVLGPYAAAELPPGYVSPKGYRTTASMYHRGDPSSRMFANEGGTGGSETRKKIIKAAIAHVDDHALPLVASSARNIIERIRYVFLDMGPEVKPKKGGGAPLRIPHNLLCTCANGGSSLECCDEYDSRDDIQFGAQDLFDDALFNMQAAVQDGLLDSVANSVLLQETIWMDDMFAPSIESLPEEDRDILAAHQVFNFSHNIRHYSREEVDSHLGGKTLWQSCMEKLFSSFFTLPVRLDGSVDADVFYDPIADEPVDGTEQYLHVVEKAVNRILLRASEDSPVFWSNVNRYIPSDSVWCEEEQDPKPRPSPPAARISSRFMGADIMQDTLLAPALADVVFPGEILAHCYCGWEREGKCGIPSEVCADHRFNTTLHGLCQQGRVYSTRAELLLVIRTLQNFSAPWRRDCDASKPSTAWGFLSAEQSRQWYEGQTKEWEMDLHTVATRGPAGVRLSHVGNGKNSLWEYARTNSTGTGNINTHTNHTAAQPVCKSKLHLPDELHGYFMDVFFPMAHSIHESAVKAACSRWVVEHAIWFSFVHVTGGEDHDSIRRQNAVVEVWRERCVAQLQQVGACELRGVYDMYPPSAAIPPPHCKIEVVDHGACTPLFYTPDCLVRCGPDFFDPCACDDIKEDGTCVLDRTCQRGKIRFRGFFVSDDVQLLGMRWPSTLLAAESRDASHLAELEDALIQEEETKASQNMSAMIDFAALYDRVAAILLQDVEELGPVQEEGAVPRDPAGGYCDDLMDYWDASAQHPMGYHPSMGCTDQESNVRGFDAWMSADDEGGWSIDPARLRDMTQFADVLGASNMVCDASVFGSQDTVSFNDLYLSSKWDPSAKADPAVPSGSVFSENWADPEMEEGVPSQDPHDTPLVDPTDTILPHSVGLVREWVLQRSADSWPHWMSDWDHSTTEFADSYASAREDMVCAPPLIKQCFSDVDCGELACRRNGGSPGVCMHKDTCSQHSHCGEGLMCSGSGECVPPVLTFENRESVPVALQLHSSTCNEAVASHFQHVPNFTHANGLCKYRNWFHSRQLQGQASVAQNPLLLFPPDVEVGLTDHTSDIALGDWVKLVPHECERSYHAVEGFGTCRGDSIIAEYEDTGLPVSPYTVLSTTQTVDGEKKIRMCDLRVFPDVLGFLSPYYNYLDSSENMLMVDKTVRRCWEFEVCPKQLLRIEGQTVQRRKVRIAVREGGNVVRTDRTRHHCARDVEKCWGVGYLVGESCTEAIQRREETCVVDVFVQPLLWVVFGVHTSVRIEMIDSTQATLSARLKEIQSECPSAFRDISFVDGLTRMKEFYGYLVNSFNTMFSETVSQISNELLLSLFGISQDEAAPEDFEDRYFAASRCAAYVLKHLEDFRSMLEGTYEFEARETGIRPLTPGNSLYIMVERQPQYVPFDWLWQCGILGGAQRLWVQLMAAGTLPSCKSYGSEDSPPSDTIRNRLLKDMALYERESSHVMFVDQVIEDLDHLMALAVTRLQISSDDKSCVTKVLAEARKVLMHGWTGEWSTWSVKDFIDRKFVHVRSLDDKVGRYEHEFPGLRFSNLAYESLDAPFYTAPEAADSCVMRSMSVQNIKRLLFPDTHWAVDFFDSIKSNPFAVCVNGILLFVELNMRLMPSFSGNGSSIVRDHISSMRMERASVGRLTAENMSQAREYSEFIKNKGYECRDGGEYDPKSETNVLHQRLRECVDSMQSVGGWVVESGQRVRLHVSRDILEKGGFFLSSVEFRDGDQWLSELFSDRVTMANSETNSICFMKSDGPQVMNPFWAGDFDIETGCDTSMLREIRYIDVKCAGRRDSADKRSSCPAKFEAYRSALERLVPQQCMEMQYDILMRTNMGSLRDDATPLCDRAPPDTGTCDRVFGALHGFEGSSLDTFEQRFDITQTLLGVWDRQNLVLRGDLSIPEKLLVLQVLPNDIAGHSMVFRLLDTLRLVCLNLGSEHTATCDKSNIDWLADVESEWERQQRFYMDKWPSASRRAVSWQCPLQWLTAYSGLDRPYAVLTPHRDRNMVRFSHLTKEFFYAHPTVSSIDRVQKLRPARFISEFASCRAFDVSTCRVKQDFLENRNLLEDTVKRLRMIGHWHTVHHLGDETCDRILDWPHTPYTLRDRVSADNMRPEVLCNVYDRLPQFAISVRRSSPKIKPAVALDRGGVCHMGRLPRLSQSAHNRGILQKCVSRSDRVTCLMVDAETGTQRLQDFDILPPFSPQPMKHTRRRRCTACRSGRPPGFVNATGQKDNFAPSRAMLSTGVPMKLSTERMLANHVRRYTCGTEKNCTKLSQAFDLDKWKVGHFLPALLNGSLLRGPHAPLHAQQSTATASTQIHEERLWERPWVFCLKNRTYHRCSGSIARQEWINPKQRLQVCNNAIKSNSESPDSVKISFCLLNKDTQELCEKIVKWRDEVQAILCQASGKCPSSAFFYTPTTYDIVNQEFVYDTVLSYYTVLGTKCPVEDFSQEINDSTRKSLEKCSANAVEWAKELFKTLRLIRERILRMTYYGTSIALYVFELIAAGIMKSQLLIKMSVKNLVVYIKLFFGAIKEVLENLFDALFIVAFGGGKMRWIKDIVIQICTIQKWIYDKITSKYICPQLLPFFIEIFKWLTRIPPFMAFPPIRAAYLVFNAIDFVLCTDSLGGNFSCTDYFDTFYDDNDVTYTHPVPTRCWSTYVTFYGDTQQLSCIKSDTCKLSLVDNDLVSCGACPAAGIGRKQFGCSAVTKQCTCDVQVLKKTACRSNDECSAEASCQYIDNELSPSTGFVECSACQAERFCLFDSHSSTGVCSCGLSGMPYAECSRKDQGELALPPYAQPCVYQMNQRYSMGREFRVSFAESASIACHELVEAYCMYVEDKNAYWLVGVSSRGRRLLTTNHPPQSPQFEFHSALCLDAAALNMPHTLRQCTRACEHSLTTVRDLELVGTVPDCAFGSLEDFLHAVRVQPMLLGTVMFNVAMWPRMALRHTPLHAVSRLANASGQAMQAILQLAIMDNFSQILHMNRSSSGEIIITSLHHRTVPPALAHALQTSANAFEWWVMTFLEPDATVSVNASVRTPSRRLLFAEVVASVEQNLREFDSLRASYASQVGNVFSYRYADVDTAETRAAWLYDMGPDKHPAQDWAGSCRIFTDIFALCTTSFSGLKTALENSNMKATPAPSLRAAWKVVTPDLSNSSVSWTSKPRENFVTVWVKRLLGDLSIPPAFFYYAFESVIKTVSTSTECDYLAVQTCSKWRIQLFHGVIITGVWFLGWFVLCNAFNLGFVAVLTMPFFTMVIMSICYGYSWSCVPMIPTCFFEDSTAAWRMILPHQVAVPGVLLLDNARCQDSAENPVPQCIRSCADPPLSFTSWYSPVAWIAVELGAVDLPWLTWIPMVDWDAFDVELRLRLAIAQDLDQDYISAHRICTFASIHLILPVVFILLLALVFFKALLRSLVAIASSMTLTIGMIFASAHTEED